MKKYFLFLFVFSSLFILFSCGIQVYEEVPSLAAPGGVEVELTNVGGKDAFNVIFHGLNVEEYFSGYNVYFCSNFTDYDGDDNWLLYTNNEGYANRPTMWRDMTAFSNETVFTQTVDGYPNGDPFVLAAGRTFYFAVKAYSVLNDIESEKSDVGAYTNTNS